MTHETPATDKLDAAGIEAIVDEILNRVPLTKIAEKYEVALNTLLRWINADVSRSARAREARQMTAEACDEEALRVLEEAKTGLEIQRAREIAHHLRWRASKIAPGYREALDLNHGGQKDGVPVETATTVTDKTAQDTYRKMLEGKS